jgi:WS/DGAT/MGAT family acyltransferase
MQQLSELDSSFLYLETEHSPLHVGGVYVFKRPSDNEDLDFTHFQKILKSKLGNEPFFRERLVEYPLNLDLPVWTDDPEFDADNHIIQDRLSHQETLLGNAASFFSKPLDRTRPLWEARFLEGLENDRSKNYQPEHFALLLKVHITAIDAVTGEDILSQLVNVGPEFSEPEDEQPWKPEPLPDTGSWLGAAYNNVFNIPSKLTLLAKDTAASAFYSILNERLSSLNLPSSLMKVTNTPMNQKISQSRAIENIEIPLSQVREIRRRLGKVTTNDVVMGICAEAIACYLRDMEQEPDTDLIALAPISVRSTSLDVRSGNQLSAALFSLASTESDPIRRICKIHRAATAENHYASAISASHLTELVPSCIAGLSARAYSEFLLAQKHKPMFNLPIINIPGPQFPLYFENAELDQFISTAPLFDGIGLALMIVSYNGNYSVTCTYNPDALNLSKPFSDYFQAAIKATLACDTDITSCPDFIQGKQPDNKTGFIEDVAGLVSNTFSIGK